MNVYEKIVKQQRREVSKLTLEQQRNLANLYDDTIKGLSKKAARAKSKSLTERWILDYLKELERVKKELISEINSQIRNSTKKAAGIGTKAEQLVMNKIFKRAGIDIGPHFTTMLSQVQDNVLKDIISGNLYKDKKSISSRIWNYGNEFKKDIQYTINQAMIEKKSAIELAKDLETYVKDKAKRPATWGRCYPHLKNKRVDYNAMRLARTSINHAYQNSSIQSSNMNPFVEGIEWRSALIHGRTCELCRERHGKIFSKDDVPLDHPSGLCSNFSYIPKSLDEVATELRDWLDGENNPVLDDWYDRHKDYFSGLSKAKYARGFKGAKTGRTAGEKTRKSPVNDKDTQSINKYISSESYTINEGLRNRTGVTKEQMDTINRLDVVLSKMPNYEGDLSRSLYFMSDEDVEKFIKNYEVGKAKTFEQYLSTTKGETYNPDGQVQINIINSKQGKDISKYNPIEDEILYQRGSKFKILDINKEGNMYIIDMEEYYE